MVARKGRALEIVDGSMSTVSVITDSSACIPEELVNDLRIQVVPVTVHMPNYESIRDTGTLPSRISEAAGSDRLVRSSRPFITDYLAAIEDDGPEDRVVITPAMEFAAMYRNASLAAELSSRRTVVIDSRTAAAGQALVVIAAARAAQDGAAIEEVVTVAERSTNNTDLVASLENLSFIQRSRRVPADTFRTLGDDPVVLQAMFRMRSGRVEPLSSVDNLDAAIERIAKECELACKGRPSALAVFHGDRIEAASRLADRLGGVDFISGFSIAMQVYTGPGVLGAAWLTD
ncbi:MAG: DegV family EDD domain-containing protein [Actinobacteria bacterium]|nr:DegV family EDD domain-containing protein [Actinomycetota bacterium]MCL6096049.1 DegV family EDD domain-containing protein [Actinomycetota bacterium]